MYHGSNPGILTCQNVLVCLLNCISRILSYLVKSYLYTNPNGEILRSVKNIKDLGITISYDLSWSNQIHIVVNKANKVLGVIKRVLWTNSVNEFSLLYKSLVRPILEYVAHVWCPFLVKDIVSLEKIPKESFETGSRLKERRTMRNVVPF